MEWLEYNVFIFYTTIFYSWARTWFFMFRQMYMYMDWRSIFCKLTSQDRSKLQSHIIIIIIIWLASYIRKLHVWKTFDLLQYKDKWYGGKFHLWYWVLNNKQTIKTILVNSSISTKYLREGPEWYIIKVLWMLWN